MLLLLLRWESFEPSLCISLCEKHCGLDKKVWRLQTFTYILDSKSTHENSCQIFAKNLVNEKFDHLANS